MKCLYEFYIDCCYGELTGLFVASQTDVEKAIGKEVYFGEVLGKHSEVICTLEEDMLTIKSRSTGFINELQKTLGCSGDIIIGYNPLDYLSGE